MSDSGPVADVCVIGRTNFNTGIGSIAYAACELLSRYYSVSLFPVHSGTVTSKIVRLPSGRKIPIASSPARAKAVFFADVLWNGEKDLNYTVVPEEGYRIAHLAYDSDVLPPEWVEILNSRFDVVYFTSDHLRQVAHDSGVRIPVGWLPIGLDLAPLLCTPPTPRGPVVRFGSVNSFHRRKGTDILVQAFLEEFGDVADAELVLHSNLAFGEFSDHLRELIAASGAKNATLSVDRLNRAQVVSLLQSFDVFASCSTGEGYAIGPREALALGTSLVLSDLGPHSDLLGVDGVTSIPVTQERPAEYPEIDGRIFGSQFAPSVEDTRKALRLAFERIRAGDAPADAVRRRRARAAEFSFERLAPSYAAVVSPEAARARAHVVPSPYVVVPEAARTGASGARVGRQVVPAFDGSVLTVLNAYLDALVDSAARDHAPIVLPDWNVERVFRKAAPRLRWFRYDDGTNGNLWTSFFRPPYGLPAEVLEDEALLYDGARKRRRGPDPDGPGLVAARPIPNLHSPDFARQRRLYAKFWRTYVRLAEDREAEVARIRGQFGDGGTVGVCVPAQSADVAAVRAEPMARQILERLSTAGVECADRMLVLASSSRWLGPALRPHFRDVFDLSGAADREPGPDSWPVPRRPSSPSPAAAWGELRDALVLAECDVVACLPGDFALTVSAVNPAVGLVALGTAVG